MRQNWRRIEHVKGGGVRVIGYLQMRAVGGVVEGPGFGQQEHQLRAWADRHGHELVRTVIDRCSADTPGPGLIVAERAVRAGYADAVVVTSRSRLAVDQPLGVPVLAVDDPAPPPAAAAATGRARPWETGKDLRSLVATLLAAGAAALVAHGVATAATVESPSSNETTCVANRGEVVPCDGTQSRVPDIDPRVGCSAFTTSTEPQPDGIWLCLDDH
ncbi:MAG: recombinase family protein [Actinobacteria bacterium]|nr:recombinase family protein [Actinomycetota bacterium]